MKARTVRKAESNTRWIAQYGSLVAAVMFAIAFLTDQHRRLDEMVMIVFTACIVMAFAGYALAWTKRFEVPGSLLAIAGFVAAFLVADGPEMWWPLGLMFVAAVPAAMHLVAVWLHRVRRQQLYRPRLTA